MRRRDVHACLCEVCRAPGRHPVKTHHRRFNLLLADLDERQRRRVAAWEALRLGYGGQRVVARITGLSEHTLRRGRLELLGQLPRGPRDRVRRAGAGRPTAEKKIRGC